MPIRKLDCMHSSPNKSLLLIANFIFKGVITGLLTGHTFTIWVLIGSLIYPPIDRAYPTSIDACPADKMILFNNATSKPIPDDDHSGVLGLYHMAFLLVPITGFVISLCVGTITSLLTGGYGQMDKVNPNHLSPLVWFIWPSSCVPKQQRADHSVSHKI